MKTLALDLDDDLDAALEAVSLDQGRQKTEVVTELLRRFVDHQQLKRVLRTSELSELYEQLASEDLDLARQGMEDYENQLREADQS